MDFLARALEYGVILLALHVDLVDRWLRKAAEYAKQRREALAAREDFKTVLFPTGSDDAEAVKRRLVVTFPRVPHDLLWTVDRARMLGAA